MVRIRTSGVDPAGIPRRELVWNGVPFVTKERDQTRRMPGRPEERRKGMPEVKERAAKTSRAGEAEHRDKDEGTGREPEPALDKVSLESAASETDFAPLQPSESNAPRHRAADPFQKDTLLAQEAFDAALEAARAGDEDQAIEHYIRAAKISETAREWYLSAAACRAIGDFLVDPQPPRDLDRGFRMYRRAIAAYEQCGLFSEARELAYSLMCLKLRLGGELKLPWTVRLELLLFWATAGFGYRPLRVVGTAALIILVYALIYWATGGIVGSGGAGPVGFWQAIYFSGITFATVGYGDFVPAPHVRILALTEGGLGVLVMGFFVAVLANRLQKA